MKSADVFNAADALTGQHRAEEYGQGPATFPHIAALWSELFGMKIRPSDVALAMILVKVARLLDNPQHADSWIDIAGYAGLGAEAAGAE